MATSAERAARNEALFREANEEIAEARDRLGATGRTPFVCECEEPSCTLVVRLTASEYKNVRSSPRRFLVAPGHDSRERVFAEHDGFSVVEKEHDPAEAYDGRRSERGARRATGRRP